MPSAEMNRFNRLYQDAFEKSDKRKQLSNEATTLELAECSFKPRVNTSVAVEHEGDDSNVFSRLYRNTPPRARPGDVMSPTGCSPGTTKRRPRKKKQADEEQPVETFDRLFGSAEEVATRIAAKRAEKEADELIGCTFAPRLTPKSEKLVKEGTVDPVEEAPANSRFMKLHSDYEKSKAKAEIKRAKQETYGCTFNPTITKRGRKAVSASGSRYTDLYMAWKQSTEKKTNLKEMHDTRALTGCTFSPDITNTAKRSRSLPLPRCTAQLYEKGKERDEKLEQKRTHIDKECTFRPAINILVRDAEDSPTSDEEADLSWQDRLYQDFKLREQKVAITQQKFDKADGLTFTPRICRRHSSTVTEGNIYERLYRAKSPEKKTKKAATLPVDTEMNECTFHPSIRVYKRTYKISSDGQAHVVPSSGSSTSSNSRHRNNTQQRGQADSGGDSSPSATTAPSNSPSPPTTVEHSGSPTHEKGSSQSESESNKDHSSTGGGGGGGSGKGGGSSSSAVSEENAATQQKVAATGNSSKGSHRSTATSSPSTNKKKREKPYWERLTEAGHKIKHSLQEERNKYHAQECPFHPTTTPISPTSPTRSPRRPTDGPTTSPQYKNGDGESSVLVDPHQRLQPVWQRLLTKSPPTSPRDEEANSKHPTSLLSRRRQSIPNPTKSEYYNYQYTQEKRSKQQTQEKPLTAQQQQHQRALQLQNIYQMQQRQLQDAYNNIVLPLSPLSPLSAPPPSAQLRNAKTTSSHQTISPPKSPRSAPPTVYVYPTSQQSHTVLSGSQLVESLKGQINYASEFDGSGYTSSGSEGLVPRHNNGNPTIPTPGSSRQVPRYSILNPTGAVVGDPTTTTIGTVGSQQRGGGGRQPKKGTGSNNQTQGQQPQHYGGSNGVEEGNDQYHYYTGAASSSSSSQPNNTSLTSERDSPSLPGPNPSRHPHSVSAHHTQKSKGKPTNTTTHSTLPLPHNTEGNSSRQHQYGGGSSSSSRGGNTTNNNDGTTASKNGQNSKMQKGAISTMAYSPTATVSSTDSTPTTTTTTSIHTTDTRRGGSTAQQPVRALQAVGAATGSMEEDDCAEICEGEVEEVEVNVDDSDDEVVVEAGPPAQSGQQPTPATPSNPPAGASSGFHSLADNVYGDEQSDTSSLLQNL